MQQQLLGSQVSGQSSYAGVDTFQRYQALWNLIRVAVVHREHLTAALLLLGSQFSARSLQWVTVTL
jgi:hypothetical protein